MYGSLERLQHVGSFVFVSKLVVNLAHLTESYDAPGATVRLTARPTGAEATCDNKCAGSGNFAYSAGALCALKNHRRRSIAFVTRLCVAHVLTVLSS